MATSQETAAQSLASISTATTPTVTTTTPITDPSLKIPQPSSPKKRFLSSDPTQVPSATGLLQPTGISEMAEAKRRKTGKDSATTQITRNPAAEALNALAGSQATSKASEAPNHSAATTVTTSGFSGPETGASSAQTSPTTVGSEGLPLTAPQVASPGVMDQDDEDDPAANKAFSYPPPLVSLQSDGKRGMSLPGSTSQENGKSPAGNKKHKCPYCETEFTRHHNLKSHLLTHSHEKPYLCQTCDSRFRRLHDLKRHTKLHTGERPHICPKCNRRFARGDALARHAKGQGGCAGRRSSVGDYGNDDEQMEGMVYTDGQSHEPENIEDDEAGGASVPSIRHHAPDQSQYGNDSSNMFASRGGTTYPPIAARANMGPGLVPHGGQHSASAPGQYPGPYPPGGVFPTSQMTESPKPLSPGNPHHGDSRGNSSINQPFGRRGTRNTPPPSLPPPAVSNNQLPSLSGLAPPDQRYVLHSTPGVSGAPGPSPTFPHPSSGSFPAHSASNSLSSHGTGQPGSGERGNMGFTTEDRLWAVIKSLEAKVDRLEDEVRMLRAQQTSPTGTVSSGPPILPPPAR